MKEIEIKILDISKEEMIKKLSHLGAQNHGQHFIIEKAFDFPSNSGMKINGLLRLRKVDEKVELCYKQKINGNENFKIEEEIETTVNDFDITQKILLSIGLKEKRHREKKRTSFTLNNTKIEIDEYPKIPPYMEIEGTEENIKSTLSLLGFTLEDTCTLTATDVIKKCGENHEFLVF